MFYKYLFTNKLNKSVCNRCLQRLLHYRYKPSIDLQTFKTKNILEKYLYIKDIEVAELVVKHLSEDLATDRAVIFESNPGTGLLTEQLLKSGAQLVRVFESNQHFLDDLKKIQTLFPKRLEIFEKRLTDLPKVVNRQFYGHEEVTNWFSDIPIRDWKCRPSVKLVAVLPSNESTKFLRFLIKQLVKKDLFFSYGRTEFLVFVSEREYKYMTAKPSQSFANYRSVTVLYNTLFDIETLESVPYKHFSFNTDTKVTQKDFGETLKLVRLTPKPSLGDFNAQTLRDYHYFVSQTFMKRKNWIIPFLENWFPNCGPELIKRGIPVFKYFGDLRPEEVFDLFSYFRNETDYNNSYYKSVLLKDSSDDINITEEDTTATADMKSEEQEVEETDDKDKEQKDNEI